VRRQQVRVRHRHEPKIRKKYVIQAQARKAQLFDYQKGIATETYKKRLLIENRPFLDVF
jgi:hypothetical protein